MQVPDGGGDVGVPDQTPGHMDVLSVPEQAGGVGVTPAMGEVPSGDTRTLARQEYRFVDRSRPEGAMELPAPNRFGVDEKVGGAGECGSHLFQVCLSHRGQHGCGTNRGSLPLRRGSPSGAQARSRAEMECSEGIPWGADHQAVAPFPCPTPGQLSGIPSTHL